MAIQSLGLGLLVTAACACPSQQAGGAQGGGSAVVAPVVTADAPATTATCDSVRPHVEALYRAEAQRAEPKRVEEAVADNTAMVMRDCARAPTAVAPCVASATLIAQIEKTCLAQLDPEGTEGDALGGNK